ncbi:MAG: homoserine kinase [Chthoniobacter sp.]|jgi:homoserine kinase|nr:homoserine kinase [Chthoniobacter sp.]
MDEATIQIPATTANLGPGYDCLGVALQIYNRVTIRRGGDAPMDSMTTAAAGEFFSRASRSPFPFVCEITGDVPRSRGLGSSVTVRLGILQGLNELCGRPLDTQQLFEICAQLEGHPDNAAPAAFGGFTVAGGKKVAQFEVAPELQFVLLIPDFEVSTPDARRVLRSQIDHAKAVANCGNACRITAAFASRNYEALRGSFGDHLHQPHRLALVPFLNDVIEAAENAGALGGFLSGSGSTICCVTLQKADQVADAMLAASKQQNARTIITTADNRGAHVH